METRDQQGARGQQGSGPLLGRRALFARGSGAALGALLGARLGSGVSRAAPGPTIHLESYGAAGNGSTDDTAAIQRAVSAAPPGSRIVGAPGRVYVLNGTVYFTANNVTLDLRRATVRTGARRTGAAAATDTIFQISRLSGVRITNGAIAAPLSPYSGRAPTAKILIAQSTGCVVDHLNADCAGSTLVTVSSGGGHRIEHNLVNRGSIGGLACSNVVIRRNVITDSPYNALGIAGYRGAPAVGNQYIENEIRRFGRIGIEDASPDGATYNHGAAIRGNRIEAPAADASSGTAISSVGTASVIARNTILGATGWGIETNGLGTRVLNNQISWARPNSGSAQAPAIVINSSTPGAPRPIVSGNHIINAHVGISVYAGPYLGPVIIERNKIQNPAVTGIALAVQGGSFAGAACTKNVIEFSVPAQPRVGIRIGIQTTGATTLFDNRISYGKNTYSRRTVDVPIEFEGDDVTARGNVVLSQRRTQGNLVCRSRNGSWSGWTLSNNQFLNGTLADLSNLIHPVLQSNTGRLIL